MTSGRDDFIVELLVNEADRASEQDIRSRCVPNRRLHCMLPDKQETLLHLAAEKGLTKSVHTLLRLGWDPCLTNINRQTPGDLARANGHNSLSAYLKEQAGMV